MISRDSDGWPFQERKLEPSSSHGTHLCQLNQLVLLQVGPGLLHRTPLPQPGPRQARELAGNAAMGISSSKSPPECSCRNPSPVRQYRDRLLVDEATVDDEHHSLLLVEILQHVTRLARARGGSVWMELLHVAARPRRHGPSHNGY